jgi:hypothetical protein
MTVLAALVLAGAWLVGCSTTVYKQGDRAADSAQAAARQAQTQSQALAGTLATLSNLVDKPFPELRLPYQSFSTALDGLVAALKQGGVRGDQLVRSNSLFLASWSKDLTTITNADVRSVSEARRTEVSKQIDAATASYKQAQDALRSLVDYLQDIRRALSTDLTQNGVDVAKPLVSKAGTTASKVQDALTQADTDLTTLSAQMSSARGPAAK